MENAQDNPVTRNIRKLCEEELHWASQKPGKLYKDFKDSAEEIIANTDKVLFHEYDEVKKNVKFRIGSNTKLR